MQPLRVPQINALERALGATLEWLIQRWVATTGRTVAVADVPWLAGPTGSAKIGTAIYEAAAAEFGWAISGAGSSAGLLPQMNMLDGGRFRSAAVDPQVRRFYECTADYTLDVWSEWVGPLRPFAKTLIYLVSRNIEQLNLPLSALEASYGMGSEVISLVDPDTGDWRYSGWLRTSNASGAVIYAGFYTVCQPPGYDSPCVKVVFPLPGGSATIILRPEVHPDGAIRLVSQGRRFGEPGYYRIHRQSATQLRVRQLPIHERIHVFTDRDGTLRTNHIFRFGRLTMLRLHYRISQRPVT